MQRGYYAHLVLLLQGWPYCGRPKEKGFLYEVCVP